MPSRLLSRVIDVRPSETVAVLASFAYFFCLLSSYYLLRPLRDAMGLVGGASKLPWLFTATFLAMLVLVPIFGALASRWPPRRFVPLIYRFFALNILVFGVLFATGTQELIVSRVFFVWISVYNLFVVSIFWSVLADHFRNEQGRRLFGFIAAGGTAGALAGPALAATLVVQFGVVVLTVLAAVLLEVSVYCLRKLQREPQRPTGPDAGRSMPDIVPGTIHATSHGASHGVDQKLGGGIFSGIALILRQPYLSGIVGYLLLHTLASTFLYLEQGRLVAETLASTAERTRLFALADLLTSCIAIALQLFVTGRFIRYLGIAAALAALPIAGLLAFAGIALWPTLLVLVVVQGVRRAVDYAIARPGREVLFTVVSREAKYKAKNVIETVIYRGGDAVSGWLYAGLAALGAGFMGIAVLWAPVAAAWVALSVWLARRQEEQAAIQSVSPAPDQETNEGAADETAPAIHVRRVR